MAFRDLLISCSLIIPLGHYHEHLKYNGCNNNVHNKQPLCYQLDENAFLIHQSALIKHLQLLQSHLPVVESGAYNILGSASQISSR